MNEYVEDSTDHESMPDIPPRKNKSKHLSDAWILSQKQAESGPETDDSELEDFKLEVPTKVTPNTMASHYNHQSKSKCSVSDSKGGSKKGKKKSYVPVPVMKEDASTDDDQIDITAKDLQDIIQESLNSRGKQKLYLKTHNTSIIYRSQSRNDAEESDDDTDCSDIGVSMMDYYAIRHANQPTIHSKNIKRPSVYKYGDAEDIEQEQDTEEEMDSHPVKSKQSDNESDTSELEVNIKDYYVIRHETSPKYVAGPFEIDFGNITQNSSLKKAKPKSH